MVPADAMVPTHLTRAMRVFWPWQLLRFAIVNLRMLRMIALSHRTHLQEEPR